MVFGGPASIGEGSTSQRARNASRITVLLVFVTVLLVIAVWMLLGILVLLVLGLEFSVRIYKQSQGLGNIEAFEAIISVDFVIKPAHLRQQRTSFLIRFVGSNASPLLGRHGLRDA